MANDKPHTVIVSKHNAAGHMVSYDTKYFPDKEKASEYVVESRKAHKANPQGDGVTFKYRVVETP